MRFKGRIIYFIPSRGFGFIKTPDDKEFFFHVSNTKMVPALSMDVEFEVGPPIREGKSPMALNITPVEPGSAVPQ
jgi:cold shock CspA family protein